jgi:hypothetical protein
MVESGLSGKWDEEAFQTFYRSKNKERKGVDRKSKSLNMNVHRARGIGTSAFKLKASSIQQHINALDLDQLLGIFYLLIFGLLTANGILIAERIPFSKIMNHFGNLYVRKWKNNEAMVIE